VNVLRFRLKESTAGEIPEVLKLNRIKFNMNFANNRGEVTRASVCFTSSERHLKVLEKGILSVDALGGGTPAVRRSARILLDHSTICHWEEIQNHLTPPRFRASTTQQFFSVKFSNTESFDLESTVIHQQPSLQRMEKQ